MNCPKCNEVLEEGMRFCTKCGANIEEATKELEEQKRKEAEQEKRIKEEAEEIARLEAEVKAQREAEEKRIEEERKQEELKRQEEEAKAREEERIRKEEEARKLEEERREEELKREEERLEEEKRILEEEKRKLEEEKLRAIREAEELKRIKEEQEEKERQAEENAKKAIEVSEEKREESKEETKVVESVKETVASEAEFKPAKKQKSKPKRKGFIRRFFDRLVLIIVLIAIFVGGIYYLNLKGYLPEVVSKEINGLIDQLKDVKAGINQEYKNEAKEENNTLKEVNDKEDNTSKTTWVVENTIEAENIINLDKDVSTIIQDGKCGIVDNKTGKILLEVKYDGIYKLNGEIVVVNEDKLYNVDSKYQLADEINNISEDEAIYEYIYVKEDDNVYYYDSVTGTLQDVTKVESHPSEFVIYEEVTINDDDVSIVNEERHVLYEAINHTGNFGVYNVRERANVTEAVYQNIFDYNEDYAAAKKEDVAGFLNKEGEEVFFEYEETRNVYDNLAWAKKDGKWGIIKIEK